jgi:acyl-CoA thioester hydrolase
MTALVTASAETIAQFFDLDPMGVVWHGNYARFLELGRSALLDKIDYGYAEMRESGFLWPVIDMHIRYYRPVVLHQAIEIVASITEWEHRLKIDYLIRDSRSGQRLSKGSSLQVAVDAKSNEMLWETPAIFRQKLAPYL